MKNEAKKTDNQQSNGVLPCVSNWGDLQLACNHGKRHSNFRACLHPEHSPAGVCLAPAHCPLIKKWSKCSIIDPCC